jgi:hypothetical protein
LILRRNKTIGYTIHGHILKTSFSISEFKLNNGIALISATLGFFGAYWLEGKQKQALKNNLAMLFMT